MWRVVGMSRGSDGLFESLNQPTTGDCANIAVWPWALLDHLLSLRTRPGPRGLGGLARSAGRRAREGPVNRPSPRQELPRLGPGRRRATRRVVASRAARRRPRHGAGADEQRFHRSRVCQEPSGSGRNLASMVAVGERRPRVNPGSDEPLCADVGGVGVATRRAVNLYHRSAGRRMTSTRRISSITGCPLSRRRRRARWKVSGAAADRRRARAAPCQ